MKITKYFPLDSKIYAMIGHPLNICSARIHNNFFLDSSNCSDVQLMFHALSSEIMENAYEKVKPMLRSSISSCQSDPAWVNPNSTRYKKCTNAIGESNGIMLEDLDSVENFVVHNMNSDISSSVQIGQFMERLNPLGSNSIQRVLKYIHQFTDSYESKLSCGKY